MKKWQKITLCLLLVVGAFVLTGCGHNIASQSKGIGIRVSWTGDSNFPELQAGYYDNNTGVIRGNATYTSSTATGGGLLSGQGGTSQTFQLSTGIQVNEGNLVKILTDPNTDAETKIALVKALTLLNPPKNDGADNKTSAAQSKVLSNGVKQTESEEEQSDEGEQVKPSEPIIVGKLMHEDLTVEKNKKLTIPATVFSKAGLTGTVKVITDSNKENEFYIVGEDFVGNFEEFKSFELAEDGSLQFGIGKLFENIKVGDTVSVDVYKSKIIVYNTQDTAPKAVPAAEQK